MDSARPTMLRAFLAEALTVVIRELTDADFGSSTGISGQSTAAAVVRALRADCLMGESSMLVFTEDFLRKWDLAMLEKLREAGRQNRDAVVAVAVADAGSRGVVDMRTVWHCPNCGCRNLPSDEECICGRGRRP